MADKLNEKRLREILNNNTDYDWLNKSKEGTTRFVANEYVLLVEPNNSSWTLKLFDNNYDLDEPKWALGPLRTIKDVEHELEEFIKEL